jgi:FkbM family methyltransferase
MKNWSLRENCIDDSYTVKEVFDELAYSPNWFEMKNEQIKTVVDIGALIGAFTVWAVETFPNATVYSFEPDNDSFKFLTKNFSNLSEDQKKRVKLYNYAVWKDEQELILYGYKTRKASNSLVYKDHQSVKSEKTKQVVKTMSFNKIFDLTGNIDLVKMDCEGAEHEILLTMDRSHLSKIRYLVGEFHNFDGKSPVDKLKNHLINMGFLVEVIPNGTGNNSKEIGYIYASRQDNYDECTRSLQKIFDREEIVITKNMDYIISVLNSKRVKLAVKLGSFLNR